jgi:hypothetical protein
MITSVSYVRSLIASKRYFTPVLAALRKDVNFLGIFAKWMLTELACSSIILIDVPEGALN